MRRKKVEDTLAVTAGFEASEHRPAPVRYEPGARVRAIITTELPAALEQRDALHIRILAIRLRAAVDLVIPDPLRPAIRTARQ